MAINNLAGNLLGLNLGARGLGAQTAYDPYASMYGNTTAYDPYASMYGNATAYDPYSALSGQGSGYDNITVNMPNDINTKQGLLLEFINAFVQIQQVQNFLKTLLSAIFGGGQMQIANPYAQQDANPYAQLY